MNTFKINEYIRQKEKANFRKNEDGRGNKY